MCTQDDFLLETSLALALCTVIDSPYARQYKDLVEAGRWEDLVLLMKQVRPNDYDDAEKFADDWLIANLWKKSPNLPLKVDKAKVATDAFFASEAQCRETNDRFALIWGPSGPSETRPPYPGWFGKAKDIVSQILGPLTQETLTSVGAYCGHGPGATVGVPGAGAVGSDKFDNVLTLTEELFPFCEALMGQSWYEYSLCREEAFQPKIVDGGTFFTVPKTAMTDRGCSTEPTLNAWLQKGISKVIRLRLKRYGVDLSDQTVNQIAASKAHVLHDATIDMSQASDLWAWSVVAELLPLDWYRLLSLARSTFVKVDGVRVELEKFSTMGNGFTFALESLLFFAICRAVTPESEWQRIKVYGDDIILPQDYAADLIEALCFAGHNVNYEKSYLAGRFFESCGTDWFDGKPVRPFYMRRDKDKGIPYALQLANALRLYAKRRGGDCCDNRFEPIWVNLVQGIPSDWRSCMVPPEFGDVGVISTRNEALSAGALTQVSNPEKSVPGWDGASPGWENGIRVRTFSPKPLQVEKQSGGVLLKALLNLEGLRVPDYASACRRLDSEGIRYPIALSFPSRRLSVREECLTYLAAMSSQTDVASKGREPRVGLFGFGHPVWIQAVIAWGQDLKWDTPVGTG